MIFRVFFNIFAEYYSVCEAKYQGGGLYYIPKIWFHLQMDFVSILFIAY